MHARKTQNIHFMEAAMYYSFILFKPDALERGLVSAVLERLLSTGVKIEIFDYVYVTEERIYRHYWKIIEEYGGNFQEKARRSFAGKYVIPVIVSSKNKNIIQEIRNLIGPTDPSEAKSGTIRADFGTDTMEKAMAEGRCCENIVHACDSSAAYSSETELWFGRKIAAKYALPV